MPSVGHGVSPRCPLDDGVAEHVADTTTTTLAHALTAASTISWVP